MPVGTSFENSAMKSSFSLSSLQASGVSTPDRPIARPREFNSLTKTRRRESTSTVQQQWRRSWGSTASDQKDDFWSALQANYNYIMDNQLIDNCQDANCELSENTNWTLVEFYGQFSELYSWLNNVQDDIYGHEDNITNKALRAEYVDKLSCKSTLHEYFNQQASHLIGIQPDCHDEISWRVSCLNAKWESIESAVKPSECDICELDTCTDIDNEIECLRKWLRNMEAAIQPLVFRVRWTKAEIEMKTCEHTVLHQDIEKHGKIVNSVVKLLCRRTTTSDHHHHHQQQHHNHSVQQQLQEQPQESPPKKTTAVCCATGANNNNTTTTAATTNTYHGRRRIIRGLERRWHLLFLRSLEWQCYIETLAKRDVQNLVYSDDSDDEPVLKHPRLAAFCKKSPRQSVDIAQDEDIDRVDGQPENATMNTLDNNTEALPQQQPKPLQQSVPKTLFTVENTKFNQSKRNAPNLGTFYFCHVDTDSDLEKTSEQQQQQEQSYNQQHEQQSADNDCPLAGGSGSNNTTGTSDDEWTYVRNRQEPPRPMTGDGKSAAGEDGAGDGGATTDDDRDVQRLVSQAEELVAAGTGKSAVTSTAAVRLRSHGGGGDMEAPVNKLSRVKQWLNMDKPVDSCDASDEDDDEDECDATAATTDMDEQRHQSSDTSEELNESVATYRHVQSLEDCLSQNTSFDDLGDGGGDGNGSNAMLLTSTPHKQQVGGVVMRAKYQNSLKGGNRRPWSVSCITQLSDRICDNSEGFSISESALNQMPFSSNTTGGSGKKLHVSTQSVHSGSNGGCVTTGHHSTSSTVEDTCGGKHSTGGGQSGGGGGGGGCGGGQSGGHSGSVGVSLDDKGGAGRRKRLKFKKKSTLRRSEMAISSTPYNTTSMIDVGRYRPLVKSGSFSGRSCCTTVAPSERHTVSDPSALHRPYGVCDNTTTTTTTTTTSTSGADSDDDKRTRVPVFRLGCKTNYSYSSAPGDCHQSVPSNKGGRMGGVGGDSQKSSSITTTEEQLSSLSEQAWDSFQEKYSSEAYSEAHDSDAARRLLEFGEDYRNFLDSQSDWSCQSNAAAAGGSNNLRDFSPPVQRRILKQMMAAAAARNNTSTAADGGESSAMMRGLEINDGGGGDESTDHESDSLTHFLQLSQQELNTMEDTFHCHLTLGLQECTNNVQADIIDKCDSNIVQLKRTRKSSQSSSQSNSKRPDKSELIERWHTLKERIVKVTEYRTLADNIAALRKQLAQLAGTVGTNVTTVSSEITVTSIEDLNMKIDIYTAERTNLEENKKVLLNLNVTVHRFLTENADFQNASLKTDISELYRIWNELNNSTNERLTKLNGLLQYWEILESRLDQLCVDLREDEQTLGVLDTALQQGTFDHEMATSARGVAKLLSETKLQGCSFPELLTEGSYSDSGISDEGSEHELCEREHRLAAIRRLVRQLEHSLTPDSLAAMRLAERLAAAEEELRTLQHRCRSFIVRTVSTGVTGVQGVTGASIPATIALNTVLLSKVSSSATLGKCKLAPSTSPGVNRTSPPPTPSTTGGECDGDGDGDPDTDPSPTGSPLPWFRRVLRASIPFPLAIMALICLALLLNPNCCDNMNNYSISLTPQLHYTHGPPPV